MCNFKRKFLKCCVPWLRQEPMGAMTAVSFVNVLRLLIIRAPSAWCKYQGSAELRSWATTEFSHSAGGPQLELRWGPGRAKRARARLTNFRPPLRPEKPDRKINSGFGVKTKKKKNWLVLSVALDFALPLFDWGGVLLTPDCMGIAWAKRRCGLCAYQCGHPKAVCERRSQARR